MRDKNSEKGSYRFDVFRIEPSTRTILKGSEPVHLAKRPFEILLHLIENRDRVVTRDELLETFWDGHDVYDDALRKTVSTIRHALDDTEMPWRFIETLRGSGFRFVGAVEEISNSKFEISNPTIRPEKNTERPLWRSRAVFLVTLIVIIVLSASFAVDSYLSRTAKTDSRRLPTIHSIAVLPIRNLTGDASNDYLSDGLSEGLINELSRNSELKVISRSSSFSFKNKDLEPREIAGKLGVEAIVEGSLRKFGDEMRLDVNLVRASDGDILWTNDAAKSSLVNIFTAQTRIACDLLARLDAGNCSTTKTAQNIDPEAYRLYLQGVQLRRDLSIEGLTKAVGFYESSLALAPDFAGAHEALATAYLVMETNSLVPPRSVIDKAEFQANEALRLNEDSVDALLVLSETRTSQNYDLDLKELLLRQAVERIPNHTRARMWLANVLTVKGKFAEAEMELLYVQQIDPLSQGVRLNLFELYQYWRRPEKANEQADLLLGLNPNNSSGIWMKARTYLESGDIARAKELWDRLPDTDKQDTEIEFQLRTGNASEAKNAVENLSRSEKARTSPYFIGCQFARINDRDQAFIWLERSYAMRQADLVSMKIDPALDTVRDDPRYLDLLRRVHLASN